MLSANPDISEFILMDEGAIEARPKATDFVRRFGANTKKGEPEEFTVFLKDLELEIEGRPVDLTPLLRRSIKFNSVNPKEYLFQPNFKEGEEELKIENVLFVPYAPTQMENFKLSFPASVLKKSTYENSFVIAMTVRNMSALEETDFKTVFNTFGRNASRFGFTDKLDFTTDDMMRERTLVYRVNIKNDHTVALADLKIGTQGLFKVYQLMHEKIVNDRKAAEQAEKAALEEQKLKEEVEAQKAAQAKG